MRRPRLRRRRGEERVEGGAPARARRGWGDGVVLLCLAIGVAGFAFAAGRWSVEPGPQSVQEAMQMAQAGELPFAPGGAAAGGAGAGTGGGPMTGGGLPGGAPPSGGAAPADGAATTTRSG